MKVVAESAVRDHAWQYWRREREKGNPFGIQMFEAIENGADPVAPLVQRHPYKLPRKGNEHMEIVEFSNGEEVQNLLVHDYMRGDRWMQDRGLVSDSVAMKLGQLAKMCIERGYFASGWDDRQVRNFQKWQATGSLRNVLSPDEKPLIEVIGDGEYEIVDGWGRLLPFAALLFKGFPFEPFLAFLASPVPA